MEAGTREQQDRAEVERRLADVERERDQWKARFEDVVNSKSWRLTEPLRALKGRFGRSA